MPAHQPDNPQTTNTLTPYVGPRPFERRHRDVFYGRDRETDEILSLIRANRTFLLYAMSGTGKTSLLNAAIIPRLEKKDYQVLPVARVRGSIPDDIRLEEVPNVYVFNTIISWATSEVDPRALINLTLSEYLAGIEHPLDDEDFPKARAIIFDQFEELFTFYMDRWQDRAEFFKQIDAALENDPLLHVVFAMREDHIAQLDPFVGLVPDKLRIRFRLELLRQGASLSAITRPLQGTDRSFAPGVAERIVEDLMRVRAESEPDSMKLVKGEYVEPVQLQVVMDTLWRALPTDVSVITQEQLETFGDVNQALSRFYEEILATTIRLTKIDENILRRWFDDQLITQTDTRGMVYAGPETTGGIPNDVVSVLEGRHIIRAEVKAGGRWYELTHDRFIEPIKKSNEIWDQKRLEVEQQNRDEQERLEYEAELRVLEAKQQAEQSRLRRRLLSVVAALGLLLIGIGSVAAVVVEQRNQAEIAKVEAITQAAVATVAQGQALEQAAAATIAQGQALQQADLAATAQADALNQAATATVAQGQALQQANLAATAQADALNQAATATVAQGQAVIEADRAQTQVAIAQTAVANAEIAAQQEADARATSIVNEQAALEARSQAEVARIQAEEVSNTLFTSRARQALSDGALDIALLLSLEAGQISDAPEIRGALLESLQANNQLDAFYNQHTNEVTGLIFENDGKTVISSSWDNTIVSRDLSTGEITRWFSEEPSTITAMALSPDGQVLAIGGLGEVTLWDVTTRQPIRTLTVPEQEWIYALAFSPTGQWLTAGDGVGSVYYWTTVNNELHPLPVLHTDQISTLLFSSDERLLFSSSFDNRVVIWDTSQPITARTDPFTDDDINTIALSPDNRLLAVGSRNEVIWLDFTSANPLEPVARVEQHTDEVQIFAFSPDGRILASGSNDQSIILWDTETYQPLGAPLRGHTAGIQSLVFSPDGETLVSGDTAGHVITWHVRPQLRIGDSLYGHGVDVVDGKFSPDGSTVALASLGQVALVDPLTGSEREALSVPNVWQTSLAYSADGKRLLVGGGDGIVRLWDIESAQIIGEMNKHTELVRSVALSADGKIAASGSYDDTAIIWNAETGEALYHLTGFPNDVFSVALTNDGRLLATGSNDGVKIWNTENGEEITRLPDDVLAVSLTFSPDGRVLAWGSWNGEVTLWNTETWEQMGDPITENHTAVYALAFSPNGRVLAAAGNDKTIFLSDVETHKRIREPLEGHVSRIYGLGFSPNGATLASVGESGNVRLWNMRPPQPTSRPVSLFTRTAYAVDFSSDGRLMASAGGDDTVILWDAATHRPLARLQGHDDDLLTVEFSPDGSTLASGGFDNNVMIWNTKTYELITTLTTDQSNIRRVVFSPDGTILATGADEGPIMLWDTATWTKIADLGSSAGEVNDLDFSPDGSMLASAQDDSTVILWDVRNKVAIESLRGHEREVYAVAFSPDGTTLASGGRDVSIILWDAKTHLTIGAPLLNQIDSIFSLDFSPDGTILASGSGNENVMLWDVAAHQPIEALQGQTSTVWGVRFSPDGRQLMAGGNDGQVTVWDVDMASWRTRACALVARNFTQEEWNRFFETRSYSKVCDQLPVDTTVIQAKLDEAAAALSQSSSEGNSAPQAASASSDIALLDGGQSPETAAAAAQVAAMLGSVRQTPQDSRIEAAKDAYQQAVAWVLETDDPLLSYRVCYAGDQRPDFTLILARACDHGAQLVGENGAQYRNIGMTLYNEENYFATVDLLEHAIDLSDEAGASWYYVADAYRLQNRLDLAVGAFDRALENPLPDGVSRDSIYLSRAETNKILGNFEAALDDINRVLQTDPDYPDIYTIRGLFYYEAGDLTAALNDLNRGVELDEADYYGYMARMMVLGALGQDAEALADFNEYINLHEVRNIPRPPMTANSTVTLEMGDGWVYYIPFDGSAGQHIDVVVERPTGSIADSVLVVLGPDGVPRVGNDDSSGDYDASIIDFTLPADGRYTLLVTHAGGVTQGSVEVTLTVR